MPQASPRRRTARARERRAGLWSWRAWVPLARAFGGAIFFALPLLMTMEMWWLGFYMDPLRLALFLAVNLPLLVGLSYFAGFQPTFSFWEDAMDAFVAYAVGFVAGAVVLSLFSVVEFGMPTDEIVGKIALQAVPGSIGAILASKQLGGDEKQAEGEAEERKKRDATYGGELFLVAAGALFFAFNVAPTEEMVLIAYKMTAWHGLALAALSIALMHALIYGVGFGGQEDPGGHSQTSIFARFTLVGYGVALLVSLYVLWTFGRTDGLSWYQMVMTTVVLGFPASLGAAAARLIL